jgi:hypothetical protein
LLNYILDINKKESAHIVRVFVFNNATVINSTTDHSRQVTSLQEKITGQTMRLELLLNSGFAAHQKVRKYTGTPC